MDALVTCTYPSGNIEEWECIDIQYCEKHGSEAMTAAECLCLTDGEVDKGNNIWFRLEKRDNLTIVEYPGT